jgi:hypothetical protein
MRTTPALAIGLLVLAASCGSQTEATPTDGGSTDSAQACQAKLDAAYTAYKAAFEAAQACDPKSTAVQCDVVAREICGCQIPSNVDPARRAALASAEANVHASFESSECGSTGMPCTQGCPGFPGAGPDGAVPTLGCLPSGVCGYSP